MCIDSILQSQEKQELEVVVDIGLSFLDDLRLLYFGTDGVRLVLYHDCQLVYTPLCEAADLHNIPVV